MEVSYWTYSFLQRYPSIGIIFSKIFVFIEFDDTIISCHVCFIYNYVLMLFITTISKINCDVIIKYSWLRSNSINGNNRQINNYCQN